jgi:tetratricopeptide (TPR) repeat protein
MAMVESILEPYAAASTLEEAERELDRLVVRENELPVAIGDLYDELAEHAADDGAFELAARLQQKAIDSGCSDEFVAREMLGWFLLKAGSIAEGEAVFSDLCAQRPEDPHVRITLGNARSDAGLHDEALQAFDDALVAAKRRGFTEDIKHARVERKAEREHMGLAPDRDDELAPVPEPLDRQPSLACALAWFPPDQRDGALERWPDLAEDFQDPVTYARRLEHLLRDLDRELGQHPAVAPIDLEEFISWAATEGRDPATGGSRSLYAAELHRTGRAVAWPPGRNDPCWCQSGGKYKRCCGAS